MKMFSAIARKLVGYNRLKNSIESGKQSTLLVGASEIHKSHFIYSLYKDTNKQQLVITPDEASARNLCDNINAMAGKDIAFVYPERDFNLRQTDAASREYEQIRIGVLARIASGECKIALAPIDAVMQKTMPKDELKHCTFKIKEEAEIPIDELVKKLVEAGYENKTEVDGVAQFCVRGGIVDFFPPDSENPVRVEFWGDTVDTMAYFDVVTQRRAESVSKVTVTPACEVLFKDKDLLKEALKKLVRSTKTEKAKATYKTDLDRIESGLTLNSLDKYIGLAYEKPALIFDYFKDCTVFVSEYSAIKERAKNYHWQYEEDIKILLDDGEVTKPLICYNAEIPEILNRVLSFTSVFAETFAHNNRDVSFSELININPVQTAAFSGEIKLLKEDIQDLIDQNYAVFILAGNKKAAENLVSDLLHDDFDAEYVKDMEEYEQGKIYVTANKLSSGFEYPEISVSVITTTHQQIKKQRNARYKKGKQINGITELQKGDLVVHVSHGIGMFNGIEKLSMQGITKDYIKINYAGSDTLYVPVTQLDLVSRYIGAAEDGKVRLNNLHTGEWQKTRAKAKKAVEDMADELIKLYAERLNSKGYAFSEDTEWQKDFEQRFPYVETEDQIRCIEEIKGDMEKPYPMDRVLCGDVGFGKTEVAMRAAFKCTVDGKQCAVLCPTTILAWQHYKTFLERFEGFHVNIEVLSRFRTPKQQKEIVKKLKTGEVDIIIGTHRLVQKDIEFKDLGLAIIDEEQRFGVRHKERFKEMFTNVDMLTLSATPIPRTLNMAISGIRDMSTIEQPPMDRHPVQSYVLEYDIGIIADAIKKELRRGGQCYYIYNNIETIELCAAKIQSAVPEAKIAVAHGRMDENTLSEIWRQLLEQEINILICTTIIETGVDVANCNTLIVENADRMGLSQLYQLRGRVGRSNRRAFAYFTFTRGKMLSEIATKRLSAIREFTKFGSGFRIALRDLEIRGAGSILGSRQHGHMEAVGYDMYMRLLSDAVAEKKGETPDNTSYECLIDLRLDAHIPEDYIENTAQRIDIYKKIAAIKTEEDRLDVTDELIDRFGNPPETVMSLLDVAYLRNTLAAKGFYEINEKPQGLMLYMERMDMEITGKILANLKSRAMINASSKPYIIIKAPRGEKMDAVKTLREVVAALQ